MPYEFTVSDHGELLPLAVVIAKHLIEVVTSFSLMKNYFYYGD